MAHLTRWCEEVSPALFVSPAHMLLLPLLQGLNLLRDLLAIEPAIVLNAAFCERHLRKCPAHEHLQACEKVLRRSRLPTALTAQAQPDDKNHACARPEPAPYWWYVHHCDAWLRRG